MTHQSVTYTDTDSFTFWKCFRLIFTLFSLYLLGDVFYRWDAFKFHSSFSEYLPNVALAFVLWSIVAFFSSIFMWVLLKIFEHVCRFAGLKVKAEHVLLYVSVFTLLTALAWTSKKIIWTDAQTSPQIKLTVILLISCTAIPLVWVVRNRAHIWIRAMQERITPLIFLFAVCFMISLALVGYHVGDRHTGAASQKLEKSVMPAPDTKRPNILLVTFDALTARDMSVYGYHHDTTPFIKKWAETASLFTNTEASSNYTAATTPSLMTGKRTWTHRKYHHDLAAKPFKIATENLPLIMKKYGYHTSAFIQNIVTTVNALGISRSIDTAPPVNEFFRPSSVEGMIDKYLYQLFGDIFSTYNWLGQDDFIFTILLRRIPQKEFVTEFPPALAFDRFLEVMDNNPGEPFFAWIHVMPPHAPQAPPEPFAGTFSTSNELRGQFRQNAFNTEIVRYDSRNLSWPQEVRDKVKILRDYYDEFILYCDKQFQNFISQVNSRPWSINTIILLSADHGDSFEHDYYLHKPTHLYEEVTNIPLIIKEPHQASGKVIDNVVEQVDIPATILDLANIPLPPWMEGRSLLPLMRNRELPAKPAISVSLYKNVPTERIRKGLIAVREGDYKLIHYLDNDTSLLFNLRNDPDELDNLFSREPETAKGLLDFINNSLAEANRRIVADNQR